MSPAIEEEVLVCGMGAQFPLLSQAHVTQALQRLCLFWDMYKRVGAPVSLRVKRGSSWGLCDNHTLA